MCANRSLYLCQLKHGSKINFSCYVCNQRVNTRKEMCKLIMDPKANFYCKYVQPTYTDMDVCFRPAKTTKRKHKPKAWWLSHDPTTLQKPPTSPSPTLPPPRRLLLLHNKRGSHPGSKNLQSCHGKPNKVIFFGKNWSGNKREERGVPGSINQGKFPSGSRSSLFHFPFPFASGSTTDLLHNWRE